MLQINSRIEVITDKEDSYMLINITDASNFLVYIDALLEKKINGFIMLDTLSFKKVSILLGEKRDFLNSDIILTKQDLEVLKSLSIDVLIGNGFPGYHYDCDINDIFSITFIFNVKGEKV